MANLISVADGAYPQASYDFLPPTVAVWAGYVGGHTPHAWTAAEIADLEKTGRQWWAIWTATVGRALTPGDALADASGMAARLAQLGYDKTRPVFYDVEYSTWQANPAATEASAASWCSHMREAGYLHAYWYGPFHSAAQWRADWTGVPPTSLPAGVVGIQYDHALSNDRYDISRFDASLLPTTGGTDMPLTADDLDAFWAHQVTNPATKLAQSAAARLCATQADAAAARTQAAANGSTLSAVKAELDAVKAELDAVKSGGTGTAGASGTFTITGSGTLH